MFRKYCIVKPTMASHSTPMPTWVVMYGQRISSPDPSAVARMITLAPMIFLNGSGSGRSLYSTAGRYLVGSPVESCPPAPSPRPYAAPSFAPFTHAGPDGTPNPDNDGTGWGPAPRGSARDGRGSIGPGLYVLPRTPSARSSENPCRRNFLWRDQ